MNPQDIVAALKGIVTLNKLAPDQKAEIRQLLLIIELCLLS